ncbi:chemotaxis protein CheZ [Humitalea rosea]|uniref:Chemotaxis protein CheZ n=1 Tax=Humitalea rosea TaxID=990373 RepID=A0A2W7I527_9PROT|nr:protein phosphatase CheZ [Humitalea rosea]PZW41299.1 chemotaxis protein CheZ [Humitalea rosea]
MPDGAALGGVSPQMVEAAVREVLGTMNGDLTVKEAALLAELEALGRTVRRAKAEIAALSPQDLGASHIPAASDELDAVVSHTATATNEILDVCEGLERLQAGLTGAAAEALGTAVTRIYEACSFQDVTGQRIAKVVTALKTIEARINAVQTGFSPALPVAAAPPPPPPAGRTEGERLANGPQLPGAGVSQDEIDRLLASFD